MNKKKIDLSKYNYIDDKIKQHTPKNKKKGANCSKVNKLFEYNQLNEQEIEYVKTFNNDIINTDDNILKFKNVIIGKILSKNGEIMCNKVNFTKIINTINICVKHNWETKIIINLILNYYAV